MHACTSLRTWLSLVLYKPSPPWHRGWGDRTFHPPSCPGAHTAEPLTSACVHLKGEKGSGAGEATESPKKSISSGQWPLLPTSASQLSLKSISQMQNSCVLHTTRADRHQVFYEKQRILLRGEDCVPSPSPFTASSVKEPLGAGSLSISGKSLGNHCAFRLLTPAGS